MIWSCLFIFSYYDGTKNGIQNAVMSYQNSNATASISHLKGNVGCSLAE